MFKPGGGVVHVAFTPAELVPGTPGSLMERSEVNNAFDALRSLGISLYGDILPDKLPYEVSINDGSNSNTLRRIDTNNTTTDTTNSRFTNNYDNRLGYYARLNWAGNGTVSEF